MTDNEIIRGIRENSTATWRYLYHEYCQKVRSDILPMIKNRPEIDFFDIYHDALVDLMENVKDGKLKEGDKTNIGGYIYRICERKAGKLAVKSSKKDRIFSAGEVTETESGCKIIQIVGPNTNTDPEEELETDRLVKDFLSRVLSKMSESCRTIFKRHYWDKMPMEVIAASMGLKNADTAKSTNSRCMKKYREIAAELLKDDELAEEAIRKSVEKDALLDLLDSLRQEEEGAISMAACKTKKEDKPKKK